ncbi:TPA: FRG domain-containing protein [Escherichia coli]|nr:FRG domain-containing protein [Escherichia coli]
MELYTANSLNELENILSKHGTDVLFRGQNNRYGDPGLPSVKTSFDRHGCIPSEMLKWSRYAKNVLSTTIGHHVNDFKFIQALLQHYGWRSFYIDCSSNAAVGAWFASHQYDQQHTLEMSEDFAERPVWLRKLKARYTHSEGVGYLYILDKKAAEQVGLVDLASLKLEGFHPRMEAQAAWLVGPLQQTDLPQNCFLSEIKCSSEILRKYSSKNGFDTTSDLFPPITDDPILRMLLGLPWRELADVKDKSFPIPAFHRALELPEYHESYVKIAWPQAAFFRGAKISQTFTSIDGDPNGCVIINVPEEALYGESDENATLHFSRIEDLINIKGSVAFEIDDLIQHVNMGHLSLYQKGIGVISRGANLFEVSELMVEHPGMDMTRVGFVRGWFYRKDENGLWAREQHTMECGCGDSRVHKAHISALQIIEIYLQEQTNIVGELKI